MWRKVPQISAIIGKDTIMEEQPDVYELVDLNLGKCQVVVAGFPIQNCKMEHRLLWQRSIPSLQNHFSIKKEFVLKRLNSMDRSS